MVLMSLVLMVLMVAPRAPWFCGCVRSLWVDMRTVRLLGLDWRDYR